MFTAEGRPKKTPQDGKWGGFCLFVCGFFVFFLINSEVCPGSQWYQISHCSILLISSVDHCRRSYCKGVILRVIFSSCALSGSMRSSSSSLWAIFYRSAGERRPLVRGREGEGHADVALRSPFGGMVPASRWASLLLATAVPAVTSRGPSPSVCWLVLC